jgi:hypothetical protein
MPDVVIDEEDDPTPIVRTIAARFRRRIRDPGFIAAARLLDGVFGLASTTDAQTVTITGRDARLLLTRGISPQAKIIVRLDFSRPSGAQLEGAGRHPQLAQRVQNLLAENEADWIATADRFWQLCAGEPGMPTAMALHCTDDSRQHQLGKGEADASVYGAARHLNDVFGGNEVFIEAMFRRRLRAVCSLAHAAVLSQLTQQLKLGNR